MRTYAAVQEAYGEQTLARSTIFHWQQQFTQGRASASPKLKSGRLVAVSTETAVNMIGTMLVDDDSIMMTDSTRWYFVNQREKYYSLFFPVISLWVYAYNFTQNVRTGIISALSG